MRNQQGFIPLAVLAIVAVVGVGGTGAAVASQGSVPGDGLYPVKTLTENVRLASSFGQESKTRTQLAIAEEKLKEIEKLQVRGGDDERIGEAADRYGSMISGAAQSVATSAQSGEGFDEALAELVTKATSIHLTVLAGVYEKVPDQAKPAIERAMQQSTRGQEEALRGVSNSRREEVEQEVEQRKQEVQERLDTLRQEGKPIPRGPVQVPQTPQQGGAPESENEQGSSSNRGAQDTVRPTTPGRP
ncbi:hypothetical protein HYU96_00940 [Candidatus Daviesbacteria bacterium]|nr:hypothetical protein [Candidatus Daviesbacteria bacterium]